MARQSTRHGRRWPETTSAVVLTGIVLLAPLPAASNLPLVWMFWAAVIGATGAVLSITDTGAPQRHDGLNMLLATLVAIFVIFAIWQSLPLRLSGVGGISTGPVPAQWATSQSTAPGATRLAAVRIASFGGFFFLMLRLTRNRRAARRIAQFIFVGIAVHAALAMISLKILGDTGLLFSKIAYHGNATGTFINKNSFATFLGMGLILGVTMLRNEPSREPVIMSRRMSNLMVIALLVLILITLASTGSRMGLAATLIGVVAALARAVQRPDKTAFWSLAGASVIVGVFGQELIGRMAGIAQSASVRLDLYWQVAGMIRSRPIAGYGIDSFPLSFQVFHAPPVSAGFVWDKAHSTYLTLWAEAGLLAGSIPPVAGLIAAVALWRRAGRADGNQYLAGAGFGALVLCGLHSLIDFSLEIQANLFLLLAIVALGLGPQHDQRGI